MKKIAVSIASLLLLMFFGFYLITNYSIKETVKYMCLGDTYDTGKSEPDDMPGGIYFSLNKYSWWTSLWSKSDGDINVETSSNQFIHYNEISINGELISIFRLGKNSGNFSLLSNRIFIELDDDKYLDGYCEIIE